MNYLVKVHRIMEVNNIYDFHQVIIWHGLSKNEILKKKNRLSRDITFTAINIYGREGTEE